MKINEQNFITLLQAGKEEALDYVIDHYLPLIKGVVVKTLGPLNKNDLSTDCYNEVLLLIWKNAKKFTGEPQDFKKWVCAIAKYKAVDYIRSELRKKKNLSVQLDESVNTDKIIENTIYTAGVGVKVHMYDRNFDLVPREDY